MCRLSFTIIFLLILPAVMLAQSPHGKNFKIDCSQCHKSDNWKVLLKEIKFDHSETAFPLTDQHKTVSCNSCHKSLKFAEAQSNCISCHKDIHQNTVSIQCESCHSTKSWLLTDVDNIHQQNRFPLTGLHQSLDCSACHKRYDNFNFEPIGTECIDCHKAAFIATTNPNHVALGYSENCETCHQINTITWSATNVVHSFFPLSGGHAISDCFSCHENNKPFNTITSDCYACHKKQFDAAVNPNHIAEGFSTDCSICHNINSFVPSEFQHNNTSFPLSGQHKVIACKDCHTSGYTTALSSDCYQCHKQSFDIATNPNHIENKFPTDCSLCHSTSSWLGATFDHQNTNFPLQGAHRPLDCSACHSNGFKGTPTDCFVCHQNNYNSTTAPNHASSGISTDCVQCHSQSSWRPASIDHNFYALSSKHLALKCQECHSEPNFRPNCFQCHSDKFFKEHKSGDPIDCWRCHSTKDWDK